MNNYRKLLLAIGLLLLIWAAWIGFSWHMLPVYLGLGLIILTAAPAKPVKWKILLSSTLIFLCGLSAILLYLFPFVNLPKPTGKYAVGVAYRKVESNRAEIFTDDPADTRSLYLKIWYPAGAGGQPNPYMEEGEKALAHIMGAVSLPIFPFQQLAETKTHGFTNAPVAEGRFPLLTFSHGWGSWFGQNTALMEELASQGYVVAAIAHSYQTAFAAANENTLITYSEMVGPFDHKQAPDTAHQQLGDKIFMRKEAVNREVFEGFFIKYIQRSELAKTHAALWATDISETIDFMFRENGSTASLFHHHLDTTKAGALGMSFGGAAAAEAALRDQRILGAINMDGVQFGSWISDTMRKPVLLMEAKRSSEKYSMYAPLIRRSKADVRALLFSDADHFNFSDASLFSPALAWIGVTGKVDGSYMIQAMNTIVPDYFGAVLAGKRFEIEKHLRPGEIEEAAYE